MPFRPVVDLTAAQWIADLSFHEVVSFGPAGFAAYARLRFIPDPTQDGQDEADVELPDDHLTDLDQAWRAFARLARHTTTADHCYVGVWDGYPYDRPPIDPEHRNVLDLPHRRFLLVEGPLDALRTWESDLGRGGPSVPPALVWPADHSWCFVSDVDPHWAGIGASAAAIDDLLHDPALDIVLADRDRPQPTYY